METLGKLVVFALDFSRKDYHEHFSSFPLINNLSSSYGYQMNSSKRKTGRSETETETALNCLFDFRPPLALVPPFCTRLEEIKKWGERLPCDHCGCPENLTISLSLSRTGWLTVQCSDWSTAAVLAVGQKNSCLPRHQKLGPRMRLRMRKEGREEGEGGGGRKNMSALFSEWGGIWRRRKNKQMPRRIKAFRTHGFQKEEAGKGRCRWWGGFGQVARGRGGNRGEDSTRAKEGGGSADLLACCRLKSAAFDRTARDRQLCDGGMPGGVAVLTRARPEAEATFGASGRRLRAPRMCEERHQRWWNFPLRPSIAFRKWIGNTEDVFARCFNSNAKLSLLWRMKSICRFR